MQSIRNFVITAHIDHGKSTLADRFLELTGTVEPRKMRPQYLDRMRLERERGITIKMQPVRMVWHPDGSRERTQTVTRKDVKTFGAVAREISRDVAPGQEYILNLIDTPGHVDFSYEVSRALAAVEGAILLVDATKGIQAQTVANLELARKQGLVIVPAVNKIDMPQARVGETRQEVATLLDVAPGDVLAVSAKTGEGVRELFEAAIVRIPPPAVDPNAPLRALIFDSLYDAFRGIVAHVRVVSGTLARGTRVVLLATGAQAEVMEAGIFTPEPKRQAELRPGDIGYVVLGIKEPAKVRIGDTIAQRAETRALPGYREPQPVLYAAIFPEEAGEFDALRDALDRLRLNDASLVAEPEEAHALGRGFRCGFLGTLHMEIVLERLREEFGMTLIATRPSVALRVTLPDGKTVAVRTPRDLPPEVRAFEEPWVTLEVLTPPGELASTLKVLQETRGTVEDTKTLGAARVAVRASVPLLDVIEDFADKLKSATRGFASFSWKNLEYRQGDLVRLSVLVAHEEVDALALIVPRVRAEHVARSIARRLKETVPPQLFAVAIQVALDGRIIARETIAALRKDVTAKLYGGDFTRKKKLLVKQRKGKKRMEKEGRVHIPPETFVKLLRADRP